MRPCERRRSGVIASFDFQLNWRAAGLGHAIDRSAPLLRVARHDVPGGGTVYDFGVETQGSLEAGRLLASACLAELGQVSVVPGRIDGIDWPHVFVRTDHPVAACLLSQYAGWQIQAGKFFAMGSGPMRAAYAGEELFARLDYKETVDHCFGILESGRIPGAPVFEFVAEKTGVRPKEIVLCVARTASIAGSLQVCARSVETALHKLYELGFDVNQISSGCGVAPLAPVAADDLAGIGRTNDAILYGGRVTLYVQGDDDNIAEIGPKVPSNASPEHGTPFLEIFEQAGRDFYQIDPHLFSPAEVVFQNLKTGRVHRFGQTAPQVLRKSFGV